MTDNESRPVWIPNHYIWKTRVRDELTGKKTTVIETVSRDEYDARTNEKKRNLAENDLVAMLRDRCPKGVVGLWREKTGPASRLYTVVLDDTVKDERTEVVRDRYLERWGAQAKSLAVGLIVLRSPKRMPRALAEADRLIGGDA